MKLEQLAPYLPYELKFHCPDDEYEEVQTLLGLSKTDGISTDYSDKDDSGCSGNYWSLDENEKRNYKFYNIKPILRPLSDLTKEIEVDGEKFVPMEWFLKEYRPFKYKIKSIGIEGELLDTNLVATYKGWISPCFILYSKIFQNEYRVIEKLFQWHFDVFGLIEKGEAIDINTIK